ncbi:exonuclease domain-containing protein [Muriicola soli]|uniref:DNA polymerase III subunit epsilon n=1 Tax=Muriicola soli TaxID=2507538 RepID=A0A411EB98_9FLAO|nr:exonuclease domain-containing protein [Muriicola soli]QBA64797.1 DNA polymerase III subunit epsilon [Muriicola soli]
MYCIVDIETTGNGIKGNKITEIAIFKFDGNQIVEEFTSLVNPECEIPPFITGLTGIDNDTVRNAPRLKEISEDILRMTKDCIFVAHSVNFDYNVIKNELDQLGISFIRKKLCTVRLSRDVFPGYRSYSLGKLCSSLGIPLENRHRARGDAHATVLLFSKILHTKGIDITLKKFLNARSQEATLPPSLPKTQYVRLPQKPGVYYFKNDKGEVIYTGKAKNIKKRVLSHFYDKSEKEIKMCRATQGIDFELSGNELIALLMENQAIKKLFPIYNRAQKRKIPGIAIFSYEDRDGILHLAFSKTNGVPQPLTTLYSVTESREFLEQICRKFKLCAKYCHLQNGVTQCDHFRLGPCNGICHGKEDINKYNSKVIKAIEYITAARENFIIKEEGRSSEEDALVVVRDGLYCGYGFIPKDLQISSLEDVMAYVTPQKETLEARRLINSYAIRNQNKLLQLG